MRHTTVWLVRHAETENPHVFNGAETDIGLSPLGLFQASAAAKWFRPLTPTAVISSAMRRAVDTARPIAEGCGVPHHLEPHLHERRVGDLAGTPFNFAEGPWAETLQRWQAGDVTFTTPGAESFAEIRDRVLPAWNRALEPHAGGRVVVVAHGVVCKVLLLNLLPAFGPADWTRIGRAANVSVSELVHDGNDWRANSLLQVPDVVAVVTATVTESTPVTGTKSVG